MVSLYDVFDPYSSGSTRTTQGLVLVSDDREELVRHCHSLARERVGRLDSGPTGDVHTAGNPREGWEDGTRKERAPLRHAAKIIFVDRI